MKGSREYRKQDLASGAQHSLLLFPQERQGAKQHIVSCVRECGGREYNLHALAPSALSNALECSLRHLLEIFSLAEFDLLRFVIPLDFLIGCTGTAVTRIT